MQHIIYRECVSAPVPVRVCAQVRVRRGAVHEYSKTAGTRSAGGASGFGSLCVHGHGSICTSFQIDAESIDHRILMDRPGKS